MLDPLLLLLLLLFPPMALNKLLTKGVGSGKMLDVMGAAGGAACCGSC
jgi:hypothetical protein